MTPANIYNLNAKELAVELKQSELYVREINRLIRKRHQEDFERFKMDAKGNFKRIKTP